MGAGVHSAVLHIHFFFHLDHWDPHMFTMKCFRADSDAG